MLSFTINSVFYAQSEENKKGKHGHEKHMLKSLNLTEEQKAKMKAIRENRKIAVQKRKEENKQFYQNLNKKTQEEINLILSPEQRVKFDSIQANRKLMRKEGHFGKFKHNRKQIQDTI